MCLSTASTFDTTAFNQPPKFHPVTALSLWHEPCLYVMRKRSGREKRRQDVLVAEASSLRPGLVSEQTACHRFRPYRRKPQRRMKLRNTALVFTASLCLWFATASQAELTQTGDLCLPQQIFSAASAMHSLVLVSSAPVVLDDGTLGHVIA
jgi:hypothetical protein